MTPLSVEVPNVIENSTLLGHADPGQRLHVTISLPPSKPGALQAYADAVSNPKNPYFRKFLTPSQVGALFGPSTTNLTAVVDYLEGKGFTIKLVAKNRLNILTEATVAQAESAFHTKIDLYESHDLGDLGHTNFFANSTVPSVPESIAKSILSIWGLENHTRPIPCGTVRKQTSYSPPLTPAQTSVLYNTAPLQAANNYGQGRTIGITNFQGLNLSNIPLYYQEYGLQTPAGGAGSNVTVINVIGDATSLTEGREADVDFQMVLSQSPLCNLRIYNGYDGTNTDPIGVLTAEVDDNDCDIITESYGFHFGTATNYTSAHNLHLSMTAQGITYTTAAGDHGANYQAGDYPKEEPEVTVVGGSVPTITSSGSRVSEVGWGGEGANDLGSGGGWMTEAVSFNVLPSWQVGNGVLTNENFRLFPDVSMAASGSNTASQDKGVEYFYYENALIDGVDGTSFASPMFAGSMGVVEQALVANGSITANSAGKYRLGRINDFLYGLNGNANVFYDITTGSNGNLPNGAASNAGVGWDTVTGWGAPNFAGLEAAMTTTNLSGMSVSPSTVQSGGSSTGTVTLTAAAPSGGLVVTLSSQNSSVTVPSSVTVAAGATTATFTVTTTASTTDYSSLLTATYNSASLTATLTVTGDSISGLSLSPSTVNGGSSSTGTVTLTSAAPTGGWKVNLAAQVYDYVGVPASVTVPSGSTSATFTVTTIGYTQTYTSTITASDALSNKTATLTVDAVAESVSSLSLSPTTVVGGQGATGTVSLTSAAPSGGWVVKLGSQNAGYVVVPSSITIAAGSTKGTFSITTKPFTQTFTNLIKASDAASSATATLTVQGDSVASLSVSPTSVLGGQGTVGTVTLSAAAPTGGWTVNLTSQNVGYVIVPTSIVVPAGSTTATFNITTKLFTQTFTNVIQAADTLSHARATLTVIGDSVASLTLNPTTVTGGQGSTGTVTLEAPAPTGGWVVNLTSQSPSYVGVPASITIPAGSTTGTFSITTKAFTSTYTNVIQAADTVSHQRATLTVTNT